MYMKKFAKRKTKGERLKELDKIIKKFRGDLGELQQDQGIIIIKKEV